MWVVVMTTTDNVSVLYVGKSRNKAIKIANQNDNPENSVYCYVTFYYKEVLENERNTSKI